MVGDDEWGGRTVASHGLYPVFTSSYCRCCCHVAVAIAVAATVVILLFCMVSYRSFVVVYWTLGHGVVCGL